MKITGAIVLLIGLLTAIFAVVAYWELNAAATSATPPSPDSMPLTRLVAPELFETANTATQPAELAKLTTTRVYMIGVVSFFSLALGALLLIIGQLRDSHVQETDEFVPS